MQEKEFSASMIAIYAKNDLFSGFLQEALSAGQIPVKIYKNFEGVTGKVCPDADLAVIFLESPQIPAFLVHLKSIPLIGVFSEGAAGGGKPGVAADSFASIFYVPVRAGAIVDRIRTLLRKGHLSHLPETVQIGPYLLKVKENILEGGKAGEKPLYLTEKERDILLTLFEGKGKAVDRQTLLDRVWAYAEGVETHTLETHIYRLRQKIEKNPSNPEILGTDGEGYRLLTP